MAGQHAMNAVEPRRPASRDRVGAPHRRPAHARPARETSAAPLRQDLKAGFDLSTVQIFPDAHADDHEAAGLLPALPSSDRAMSQPIADEGRPLQSRIRGPMEQRFGTGFASVRIHTGTAAAASARALGAAAYAVGEHIVFGQESYDPETPVGLHSIAHELAHVVQQRKGGPARPDTRSERAADRAADEVVGDSGTRVEVGNGTSPHVACQPKEDLRARREQATLSSSQGMANTSDAAAFAQLNHLLQDYLDSVAVGAANIPKRLNIMGAPEQIQMLAIPMIRGMLADAGKQVAAAAASPTAEARAEANRKAGALFQGALIATSFVRLQVNMLIVTSYADAAGAPSGTIRDNYRDFEHQMIPLLDAIGTLDVDKMRGALERATPIIQATQDRLVAAIPAIHRGAEISSKVIKVADILMLALSAFEVLRPGGIGEPPGPSLPPTGAVRVFAGGTVGLSGLSMAELEAALAAIRRLIAIGAIDPTIASLAGASGGTVTATIPELGKPQMVMMQGGGGGTPPPKGSPKPVKATLPPGERILVGATDEHGNATYIAGELFPEDLGTGTGTGKASPPARWPEGGKPPDADKGHLLARLFGGKGSDPRNLVWLSREANRSWYKTEFELPVWKALKRGESVRFSIEPHFLGEETAPYSVEVWAESDSGVIVAHRSIPTRGLSPSPAPPGPGKTP